MFKGLHDSFSLTFSPFPTTKKQRNPQKKITSFNKNPLFFGLCFFFPPSSIFLPNLVSDTFQLHWLSTAHHAIRSDHHRALSVDNATRQAFSAEAAEDHGVHRTDACARQHGSRKFHNHREVDGNPGGVQAAEGGEVVYIYMYVRRSCVIWYVYTYIYTWYPCCFYCTQKGSVFLRKQVEMRFMFTIKKCFRSEFKIVFSKKRSSWKLVLSP